MSLTFIYALVHDIGSQSVLQTYSALALSFIQIPPWQPPANRRGENVCPVLELQRPKYQVPFKKQRSLFHRKLLKKMYYLANVTRLKETLSQFSLFYGNTL